MKRFIMIFALVAACGDANDGGWELEETMVPPNEPEQPGEVPLVESPNPRLNPSPEEPAVPQGPVQIDQSENAACESPRRLASGEKIRQTLDGLEPTYNCLGWEMRQRYYEVVVPPHHRGRIVSDLVVYRHGEATAEGDCGDFAPRIGSDCSSDYVNRTHEPITYLVAATEFDGRLGDDFSIAYDAVPIETSATCDERVRLTTGESHTWDVRGGYDTYNPCQVVEAHNAFYFHVEFPPNTRRLKVTVSPLEPNFPIRPSIQVIADMFAQYYPQCGRSEVAMENGECILTDDSYFRSSGPAEVIIDRPEGFHSDPLGSYLVIVNTGGWSIPAGDARMEIRVQDVD